MDKRIIEFHSMQKKGMIQAYTRMADETKENKQLRDAVWEDRSSWKIQSREMPSYSIRVNSIFNVNQLNKGVSSDSLLYLFGKPIVAEK